MACSRRCLSPAWVERQKKVANRILDHRKTSILFIGRNVNALESYNRLHKCKNKSNKVLHNAEVYSIFVGIYYNLSNFREYH